jgi:hypothetical protein
LGIAENRKTHEAAGTATPSGVRLNKDQVTMLGVVSAMHEHDITIQEDGDSSPLLCLHDEEGNVFDRFRLPQKDWDLFKRRQ